MKHAILDTSFILSCIRKKIDFFEQIPSRGMKIIIPRQVIEEIKGLSKSEPEAKIALSLLKKNSFMKIDLETKNVDNGIIKTAKENQGYVIATLDREIKDKTENQKLIIRGERELEII